MSPEDAHTYSRRSVLRAGGLALAGGAVARVSGSQQRLHWRYPTGGAVFSSPTVWDETVFVGSQGGGVYAVDSATGTLEWEFKTDKPVNSSPLVAAVDAGENEERATDQHGQLETEQRTVVIVGCDDSYLYALDAETGELYWEFETGGRIQATPRIRDETVYVTSDHDGVYTIDASTGEQRWYVEKSAVMHSSPTVVGETLFVRAGNLLALDIESGWERWEYEIGSGTFSSPTVVGDTVYVGDRETRVGEPGSHGNIHAVDARSGDRRFRIETDEFIDSSPTVSVVEPETARATASSETVFVGGWFNTIGETEEHGSVFAVDAVTGSERWRVQTDGRVLSSPTTAGGVVFVGSWDHGLYALDSATGEQRFRFETDDKISSSPVVVDGTVFVGGMDGHLYGIDAGVDGSSTDSRVRGRLDSVQLREEDRSLIPGGQLGSSSQFAIGAGAVGGLLSGLGLLYNSRSG